jgi:hypothetical protein
MAPPADRKKQPVALWIAASAALAIALAIYWLRLDRVVGLLGDDAR